MTLRRRATILSGIGTALLLFVLASGTTAFPMSLSTAQLGIGLAAAVGFGIYAGLLEQQAKRLEARQVREEYRDVR